MTNCQSIFTDIYKRKVWGAGSGGGSDRGASQPWADLVSAYIAAYKPLTVISIGCGDGYSDSLINLHGAAYMGLDVVPEMVRFCLDNHHWGHFAHTGTILVRLTPLVLCKEVTQHLSDLDVMELLNRLRENKNRAVIHCSATNPGDQIAVTGGYRPVWLDRPPFNLPTERLGEWSYGQTSYQCEVWRP